MVELADKRRKLHHLVAEQHGTKLGAQGRVGFDLPDDAKRVHSSSVQVGRPLGRRRPAH